MRLIDADKLKEIYLELVNDEEVNNVRKLECLEAMRQIDEQPTAYDGASGCCRKCNSYAEGYSEGYKDGSNYVECGCEGCAFIDTEEWEMPCAKCKRAQKDYYRRKVYDKFKGAGVYERRATISELETV